MNSRPLHVVLFLLLASASVHSLDCEYTTDPGWCEEIRDSELTDAEREYLIASLVSVNSVSPDHALIAALNREIQIKPVETTGSIFIRNAWAQIGAIEPSVELNGELLVSEQGHIVADSGYEIEFSKKCFPVILSYKPSNRTLARLLNLLSVGIFLISLRIKG